MPTEVILTPNYVNVAKFQANAILTNSIEHGKEAQFMLTYIETVAYLAANNKEGYAEFHTWLERQIHAR